MRENFGRSLDVIPLALDDYAEAMSQVAHLGLSSGAIYDALHVRCAKRQRCGRIYTYNIADFERLAPEGIEVCMP